MRIVVVIVGASLIVFLMVHAIPGNPWSNYSSAPRALLGLSMDRSVQEELSHRFGLDLPMWRQFTRYLIGDMEADGSFYCGVLCGNLGPSIQQQGRSVNHILFSPPEGGEPWDSRFGYSVRMVFFAALISLGLGIPLGIRVGTRPTSVVSRAVSVGLATLLSIPNFILGLLAVIVFASGLKIIKVLPDWSNPLDWIIPAFVLAVVPMANIARVTAATLSNIMNEDYVRTAHGKGLTEARILWVHVMRNAVSPILTYLGPTLVDLFAGLLIVEGLFAFPGIGREYWTAVLKLDYPLIMGLTLLYATGIVLVNVLTELLAEIVDPRVKHVSQQGAV